MAYFSNGTEGMVFDDQCSRCKFGRSSCPIATVQLLYNYDQLNHQKHGDETAKKILDHLVSDDGVCSVFVMAKSLFEIDPNQIEMF